MVSVAKKSTDKISIGGRKYALRRRSADGVAEAEVVGIGEPPVDDGDDRSLLVPLVRGGRGRRPRDARRGPRAPPGCAGRAAAGRPADVARRARHPDHPRVRTAMALLTCDFFSEALEVGHLDHGRPPPADRGPDRRRPARRRGPAPVLYLLHGLTDDHTAWHALHLDRPVRRGRRPGRRDARGAPQLLRRRGARPPRTGPTSPRSCPPVVQSFFRVSDRARRTPSSPGCRWAGTAPSSSRSPTPTGTPRPPRCPERSTSAT